MSTSILGCRNADANLGTPSGRTPATGGGWLKRDRENHLADPGDCGLVRVADSVPITLLNGAPGDAFRASVFIYNR